jgi:hypothetical protein
MVKVKNVSIAHTNSSKVSIMNNYDQTSLTNFTRHVPKIAFLDMSLIIGGLRLTPVFAKNQIVGLLTWI